MDDQPTKSNDSVEAIASELRWQSLCLSVLAASTIGLMLYLLRPVLVPFVVAIFLTVGLTPILDVLQRRLLPSRVGAVAAAFLLGVVMLLLLFGAVTSSIDQLIKDDAYQRRAVAVTKRIAVVAERFGWLPAANANADDSTPEQSMSDRLRIAIQKSEASAEQWLLRGMASLSSTLGIVLIYMFFLLLGASASQRQSGLWEMIELKLREYIILKTFISIGTGLAVWLVLGFFQVPLALLMGLLTFLLNYIPNFGPLVTCVLPLPVIWLSPDLSLFSMIAASLLSCGVQLVSGNVIEPRLMGASFALHPIVVLLALMGWYAIWGFVGMLLAVPMTAAIKVILQRIERTAPLALLMEGDLAAISVGDQGTSDA